MQAAKCRGFAMSEAPQAQQTERVARRLKRNLHVRDPLGRDPLETPEQVDRLRHVDGALKVGATVGEGPSEPACHTRDVTQHGGNTQPNNTLNVSQRVLASNPSNTQRMSTAGSQSSFHKQVGHRDGCTWQKWQRTCDQSRWQMSSTSCQSQSYMVPSASMKLPIGGAQGRPVGR